MIYALSLRECSDDEDARDCQPVGITNAPVLLVVRTKVWHRKGKPTQPTTMHTVEK